MVAITIRATGAGATLSASAPIGEPITAPTINQRSDPQWQSR
jgi:hypothetical protein